MKKVLPFDKKKENQTWINTKAWQLASFGLHQLVASLLSGSSFAIKNTNHHQFFQNESSLKTLFVTSKRWHVEWQKQLQSNKQHLFLVVFIFI